MNYFVIKRLPNIEYRLYIEDTETDGFLIYKGHKLGIDQELFPQILEWKIERSTGKIHFLQYDKVDGLPDYRIKEQWSISNSNGHKKELYQSWESVLKVVESRFGNFRKISITKVNI